MTPDRDLQDRVLKMLDADPGLTSAGIGVIVKRGVVTLVGPVETLGERWLAERIATSVTGVRAVVNRLEVVESRPAPARTDATIAFEASRALGWTAAVPLGEVVPAVSDGWITLAGTVEREDQRYAAERAIRHIAGVRGVSNVIGIRAA